MMLLATEPAVCAAFIIAEPHLTFNWPLKYTGEMELHREGVEDPILVTPICLPVNCTPLLYTALKNQPYEGLCSDSHSSPHLQGPRQSLNDQLIAHSELQMRVSFRWP